MANTGNTQQQINYGASANDGQGDPLRTAFIKTDDNFDNVWLAGPVGSNITIGNNTIQSNNTNGNIILKPNGTGIVQANASIIPNADNTRDLGSSTLAWRRAYIDELLPDSLTVSGDAVIGGNLTVEGDTIQIGNITTDTLTIQLANTAANTTAANGAGITVGASDNIATILYNSTANRWNVSVGLSAVGNISAPYFMGNGSLLTGITSYGNANVAANLAAFSNNPISTTGTVNTGRLSVTGNVTANAAGNVWSWDNDRMRFPSGASWRSDRFTFDEYISSAVDGYLNFQTYDNTNNVATELHMEHGLVQFNIYNGALKTWNFNQNGTLSTPGNIFATGSITANVSGNNWSWTDDLMEFPSGALWRSDRFTLDEYIQSATDGYLNLQTYDNTANVATELHMEHGVVQLNIYNGNNVTWEFDSTGNLTLPGNTFAVNYANGSAVSLGGGYGNANVANYLPTYGGNISAGNVSVSDTVNIQQDLYATTGTFTGDAQGDNAIYAGFPTFTVLGTDVVAQFSGNTNDYIQFNFQNGNAGNQASGDYVITADNGNDTTHFLNIGLTGGNWDGTQTNSLSTRLLPNDGYMYVQDGNLAIGVKDGVSTSWIWRFDITGSVTADGNLIPSANGNYSLGNSTNYWANVWLGNITTSNISVSGNITGGNISTGVITLTNGATIKDTVGNAVAFGRDAAATGPQGNAAVAIGQQAGETSQGLNAVAIGALAGTNTQNANAVAIGRQAGSSTQGISAVAVGTNAGQTSQGDNSVAIGVYAAANAQGQFAVAIGDNAGNNAQGTDAVAIGASAGLTTQGTGGVALGQSAGQTSQGNNAVALGKAAGQVNQGINSIAIGQSAGLTNQGNNSIILNATGNVLEQTTANTFTVAPVRNDVANVAEILFYDTTSKEVTYGNVISVTGNITGGNILTGGLISATGNITGNYILGNGSQLTSINAVTVDITDTNGLTTVYYPTFVENRTTAQIARADVDLTYRTDDNLLTVGNVSVTGNITGNTAGFAIGYRDIPQVVFTGNATIATTDAGKHFYSTQSTDYILTIANNASQGFQTGAAITVVNQGTGNITLARGSGVTLYLTGNATSGNRTVTTFGMATLIKVATDTWFVSGAGVI